MQWDDIRLDRDGGIIVGDLLNGWPEDGEPMSDFESKLVNCQIVPRGDELLFMKRADGTIECCLDGYRIAPIEDTTDEIERLRAVNEDAEQRLVNMEKVVQANIESGECIRAENERLRAALLHTAACNNERLRVAGIHCDVCDELSKAALKGVESNG